MVNRLTLTFLMTLMVVLAYGMGTVTRLDVDANSGKGKGNKDLNYWEEVVPGSDDIANNNPGAVGVTYLRFQSRPDVECNEINRGMLVFVKEGEGGAQGDGLKLCMKNSSSPSGYEWYGW